MHRSEATSFTIAARLAHAAALEPKKWPQALATVADYIGASGGLFVNNEFSGGKSWMISARLDEHLGKLYLERHTANPSVMAVARAGPGVHATHAITSLDALHRSEFGADILCPQDIKSMFQFVYEPLTTGEGVGGFGFTLNSRQFEDEATIGRRARRIAPQLRLAANVYFAGAQGRDWADAWQLQLQLLAEPAIIASVNAMLLAANDAADALLSTGDLLRHDRLHALYFPDDHDNRRLRQAILVAAREGRGTAFPLRDRPDWLATVTPHTDPAGGVVMYAGRALLRLIEIDADHNRRAETARMIFSLTPRETSVLSHMTAGRSVPEIADRLRVSTETVRSHMKSLFGKTGATSRTGVAQLVARLPLIDQDGS